MNIFLLFLFISNIFVISPNYTYELIEELIPKTITFNSLELNSFKIFLLVKELRITEKIYIFKHYHLHLIVIIYIFMMNYLK